MKEKMAVIVLFVARSVGHDIKGESQGPFQG
jgi:hypothetical protein